MMSPRRYVPEGAAAPDHLTVADEPASQSAGYGAPTTAMTGMANNALSARVPARPIFSAPTTNVPDSGATKNKLANRQLASAEYDCVLPPGFVEAIRRAPTEPAAEDVFTHAATYMSFPRSSGCSSQLILTPKALDAASAPVIS